MKKNLILIALYALLTLMFKNANAQTETNPLSDKILIVVHMQEPVDQKSKESSANIIEKINQLIEETEPENVIYAKSISKFLNVSFKKICVDKIDTPFDSRLKIVNQNVFTDESGDVFESDELNEFIKTKKINQIVIVGRVAEGCITKTILSGKKIGYEMFMIPEAIAGRAQESKTKALNKLEKKEIKKLDI
ncbi:MAG: isochorismatase family protein [Bacteroidales bacterium]|nr:isochorismatase family protein [Bacteroidales bacterium]